MLLIKGLDSGSVGNQYNLMTPPIMLAVYIIFLQQLFVHFEQQLNEAQLSTGATCSCMFCRSLAQALHTRVQVSHECVSLCGISVGAIVHAHTSSLSSRTRHSDYRHADSNDC